MPPALPANFLIVQSTGGLFDVEEAQSACIRMLESGPAAGVIGTKALCDRIGLKNAIAFDMGGTTAKAGVIHDGQVLMTGSALIGGYATGLPVQMPMIDIQEVGTGGGASPASRSAARCMSVRKARARSPARCATGAAAPSRPSPTPTSSSAGWPPTAFSAARCASTSKARESALEARRRHAARSRSQRGGRRHSAHRHDQNVPCGALGDHRARPRRRRLRARRLWRRRTAACVDGGARTAHRAGRDPARSRPFLRLRHAGRGPAA